MDGSAVWSAYVEGKIDDIRDYCETDVVNTDLVYLRFQQMRGAMTPGERRAEEAFVREQLQAIDAEHWRRFVARWAPAA
jgi:predicted PolB exonuclease-like 3'-5' exonuclease